MPTTEQNLETLKDIRKMMEKSSRFISLSGWSGITAGITALAGIGLANNRVAAYRAAGYEGNDACPSCLKNDLITIAAGIFIVAFVTAVLFTYLKSRKEGVAIWGNAARRLLWNTLLPMVIGGLLIWKMISLQQYQLIAPSCLIFYGLALINGSKFTMGEVRFLGYAQLAVGVMALLNVHAPLVFLSAGFGMLHILYGTAMWWRYDRKNHTLSNR